MTLASELTKVQYSGDGSTTAFTISFVFYENSGIKAILLSALGVETTQVLDTDYTLSGGTGTTGTLTMTTAPASGETLTIKSDIANMQDTSLPLGGALASTAIELRLDILTRLIQQKEEQTSRTLLLTESTILTGLTFPAPGAGEFIKWNDAGTTLVTSTSSVVATLLRDTDLDTKIQVEESSDEDIIRFDVAGSEIATMSASTIAFGLPLTTTSTVDGRDIATDGTKLDKTVFVTDHGATGDGVTDDSAAFTTAATASSGAVVVPAGTYKLDSSPTGSVTWMLMDGATTTGSGVLPNVTLRIGANQLELQRIDNSTFPLNFATDESVFVVQWDDSGTLSSNSTADGAVLRHQSTGDGSVTLTSSLSGGTSVSIWRGTFSGMIKSGDGSGHSYTANGQLGDVGATGYNELGLFVGIGTNISSTLGTVHGSELLVRDGPGTSLDTGTAQAGTSLTITLANTASSVDDTYNDQTAHTTGGTGSGQYRLITGYVGSTRIATVSTAWSTNPDATTTYEVVDARDSFIISHIARNARYVGGARKSISFGASAEGDVASSSILEALPNGVASWNVGLDFIEATFSSGRWANVNRGVFIGVDDGTGTIKNMFGASSTGVATIRGINTNEDTELQDQSNTTLLRARGGLSAGNPISIVVGGTLKQVTEGATNSGGTGFKLLRVIN